MAQQLTKEDYENFIAQVNEAEEMLGGIVKGDLTIYKQNLDFVKYITTDGKMKELGFIPKIGKSGLVYAVSAHLDAIGDKYYTLFAIPAKDGKVIVKPISVEYYTKLFGKYGYDIGKEVEEWKKLAEKQQAK